MLRVRGLELGLHHRVLDHVNSVGSPAGSGMVRSRSATGQLGAEPGQVDPVGRELGWAGPGGSSAADGVNAWHRLEQRAVVGRRSARIGRGRDRDQRDQQEPREQGDQAAGGRHRDNLSLTHAALATTSAPARACRSATPRGPPRRRPRAARRTAAPRGRSTARRAARRRLPSGRARSRRCSPG